MATNKGIPVINNFDLYSNKAIDSRLTIENEQELGELVNKGAIYDGMIFYRKDAQKFFQAQYLESGLKISEFGGATSLDDCLFLVANASQQVALTQEQYNNIVNKKYNFIFLSVDGLLLLPTYINVTTDKVQIDFTAPQNDTTKMTMTTLEFSWTPTQLTSTMSPYPASLDVSTEELTYIYYENGEPKQIKFVGLPNTEGFDVSKPFVPQLKSGRVSWVEQTSDIAIITLSDSQVQSLNELNITFTQEQATLLEKATSFKFIYNNMEIGHGQLGKVIQGETTLYGIFMALGYSIFIGSTLSGFITSYTETIVLVNIGNIKVCQKDDIQSMQYGISIGWSYFLGDGTTIDKKDFYFDTINGLPIIHNEHAQIKDHAIPTITFVD